MELKKMKCPSCGGKVSIPEDGNEIKCEFCGSNIVIDDKATEVGRIKKAEVKAKKELDEHLLETRKKKDNYDDERNYKKKKEFGKLKTWSIIMAIICLLFTFTGFRDGKILSGLIGIIQVALFGYSFLLCLEVLPEKFKNLHKITFIGGLVLIIPFISLSDVQLGGSSSFDKEKAEDIVWSDYVLSEKLPEPKKLRGRLNYDSSESLSLYIMEISKNDYKDYVSACKEKGYTVDAYNSNNSYRAKNEKGYSLSLYFDEDDKEYSIHLDITESEKETDADTTTTKPIEDTTKKDETSNGLRSDFKKAMDSYESFMNEYVDFMKKYLANPSDTSLLKDYAKYLEKYTKFVSDFDKWEEEDMNDAETKYYLEVQSRVLKKLSEVQ